MFFADRGKESADGTVVNRQNFVVAGAAGFHGQPVLELIFGVLADQINPHGIFSRHCLILFGDNLGWKAARVQALHRLDEFVRWDMALAAVGEQVVAFGKVFIDQDSLCELDGASAGEFLIMFNRVGAAERQRRERDQKRAEAQDFATMF